ncbi:APC family permease [Saxibacter everestensis]|uniref:APC family permease n=1 Tax=Saxibacter everestensis TaxID=2909229 RepID=A0ABY8QT77_9MICO|nr:APC family permease [Brevibacteriaceae bacterium ZFBP1038]
MTANAVPPRTASERPRLRRSLGLTGLTIFGLTYLGLGAVFTVYGPGVEITDGHLPAAYILATATMLFTAYSYGRMAVKFPVAGSAYTYSQQSFGGNIGFLTGWTLMLDYLFLPMINFLLIGIYLNAQFPAIPQFVFTLAGLLIVLGLNIVGIKIVAKLNFLAVGLGVLITVLFVVFSIRFASSADAQVSLLTPLVPGEGGIGPIFAGAAVLALAFLGFDAVSTLSEEARRPKKDIPRAIMLTTLIGGGTFFVVALAGSLVYPDWRQITNLDAAGLEMMQRVGGSALQALFVVVYIVGTILCGAASQVSVSRILYSMGRDGILPRPFGYLHPRFRTPVFAAIVVSAFSLVALFISLDAAVTIINFGALAAFSMVNLSVIKSYLFDQRRRSPLDLFRYGLLPAVGFALTLWLWTSLTGFTFVVGLCWMLVGAVILAVRTRFFRRKPPMMDFSEREELEVS